ncbi:MAG: NADH-quinone oxidoreductase subunit J family protein [Candidatus Binataceae bacterium]
MPLWLFGFLAALAVAGALGVIVQRNPVHCLLALALTLTDIGALFMGLGAETVGFLQIIIYVGAIMILFLFVIWLLNLQLEPAIGGVLALKFLGVVGAAVIATLFFVLFARTTPPGAIGTLPAGYGSIQSLARTLFSDYLIAFEVTSVLLLAAVAGAIGLARRGGGDAAAPAQQPGAENIRSAAG